MNFQSKPVFGFIVIALLALTLPLIVVFSQKQQQIQQHAAGSFPHVVGTQLVDENGAPLVLHGAQLEGMLNGNSTQVTQNYDQIVHTMASWHMNTIRLPSCNWFWKADPAGYMTKIQTAVQQANQAGLYVIIDLHDDHNCNPPYPWPEPYHLPRPEMDTYWQAVATLLKNNPRVIFDIYNEPDIQGVFKEQYTDTQWKLWLNGGTVQDANGTETFIGMQHLVDVIRQTGAQQILMVEGYTTAETFHNIGTNTVTDTLNNIVYEAHKYSLLDGPAQWDIDFGFMATQYPVFVGEWALMGGDNSGQTNCGGVTSPQQADQVVSTFLNYLDARHMGWTAYSFDSDHLIVDYINFTPTAFSPGWVCPQRGINTLNHAGMGQAIKNYLGNTQTPIPTITTLPTLSPIPTLTPPPGVTITPTPSINPTHTILSLSVCPHGLGNCGDNANPTGGNQTPLHPLRPLTVSVFDLQNSPIGSPLTTQVQFIPSSGTFQGLLDAGNLSSGTYILSFHMHGYLPVKLPQTVTITTLQTTTVPMVSLVAGNIDNNQSLDLADYNILVDCFGAKQIQATCTGHHIIQPEGADLLDDDGQVDGADYNLMIREFSVQKGG